MAAADTLKTGSRQVAAGAAAGITQLAQAAPEVAQVIVEGTLQPLAADVAEKLPQLAEGVGTTLLQQEGGVPISFHSVHVYLHCIWQPQCGLWSS